MEQSETVRSLASTFDIILPESVSSERGSIGPATPGLLEIPTKHTTPEVGVTWICRGFFTVVNHDPPGFFSVRAFRTLLFVSSVIEGSPDSRRRMVLVDRPASLANSTLRSPNFTRCFRHQPVELILSILLDKLR